MRKNSILVFVNRRDGTKATFYKVLEIADGYATIRELVAKREDIFNLFTHFYSTPTKKFDKYYRAKRRKIRTDGEGIRYVKVWNEDQARVWDRNRILCGTAY